MKQIKKQKVKYNRLFISLLIFISVTSFAQTEDTNTDSNQKIEPYVYAEQMPEFPGGQDEMYKFIAKNLIYPKIAIDSNIEGRVHLKFTIQPDGSIADIKVLNNPKLGYGCEEAAIAVIKKMPKWKPGKQNGKPIPVYFNLPIRFRIN